MKETKCSFRETAKLGKHSYLRYILPSVVCVLLVVCCFVGLHIDADAAISGGGVEFNKSCSSCGNTVTSSYAEPTCTNGGLWNYYCGYCGYFWSEMGASALGHNYVNADTSATCTSSGTSGRTECSRCGNVGSSGTTVPATGHDWSTAYDCEELSYCLNCGKTGSYGPHSPVSSGNKSATCYSTGVYGRTECSVCGDVTNSGTTYGPVDHNYNYPTSCDHIMECQWCTSRTGAHQYSSKVTTAATCTSAGVTTYTCTGCTDSYTVAAPAAKGHSYADATCTAPKSCTSCGATTGSVNSSNHTGSSTYGGTSGVHTKYSCCGATISTSHSYTVDSGVQYSAATCTAKRKNYLKCSCGYNPKSSSYVVEVGSALGHSPNADDGDCTTAITCKTCGAITTAAKTHTFTDAADTSCNNSGCTHTRVVAVYLDVNGLLDGSSTGNTSGYGTFDVYVNGSRVADDVSDYYTAWNPGSTYEIKDIKATVGHTYIGVSSGSISGTIGTSNLAVWLQFITNTYTIDYNCGQNLFYNMINVGQTTEGNALTYSVSNGVVTAKAGTDDAYAFMPYRVYLEAGKTYTFSYTCSISSGTHEAFLMKDGQYTTYYYMGSGTTFTPTVTGTYWLRLDVNTSGATGTFSNIRIVEGSSKSTTKGHTLQSSHTYGVAKTLTSNGYSRPGYTFAGWNTKADGTGTSYANGASVSNLTATNGATVTLFAQWTPVSYKITYDEAGGSAVTDLTYNATTNITLAAAPTRAGYTFKGWKLASAVNNWSATTYSASQNIGTGKYGNITLVAQWTANTYYVTYDANGGTGAPAKQAFTFGAGEKLSTTVPTRTGYTFVKWVSNPNNNDFAPGDTIPTGWGDFTLIAQWTPVSYKITYDEAGGSAVTDLTYNITTNVTLSAAPTRAGYTFKGWKLASAVNNWSATTYSASQNIGTGKYGNITLVAQWTANRYTLTYNPNGGAINPTTKSYSYNSTVSLIAPTRTGYTFKNWYFNATGTNYLNLGRQYMYTDKISIHIDAYMDNWGLFGPGDMRLISCTEGGGWNI